MQNNNAGYLIRLLATLIDNSLHFLISLLAIFLIGKLTLFSGFETLSNLDANGIAQLVTDNLITFVFYIVLFSIIYGFFNIAYYIYFVSTFGGTVGKLICGLRIENNNDGSNIDLWTAFWRTYPGYTFSSIFLGLGYFQIIRSKENRAWHDELFDTRVVKTNSLGGLLGFIAWVALNVGLVMLVLATISTVQNSSGALIEISETLQLESLLQDNTTGDFETQYNEDFDSEMNLYKETTI